MQRLAPDFEAAISHLAPPGPGSGGAAQADAVKAWTRDVRAANAAAAQQPISVRVPDPPAHACAALLNALGRRGGDGTPASPATSVAPASADGKRLAALVSEAASAAAGAAVVAAAQLADAVQTAADAAAAGPERADDGNSADEGSAAAGKQAQAAVGQAQAAAEQARDSLRAQLFWGCTALQQLCSWHAAGAPAGAPPPRWLAAGGRALQELSGVVAWCCGREQGGAPLLQRASEQLAADRVSARGAHGRTRGLHGLTPRMHGPCAARPVGPDGSAGSVHGWPCHHAGCRVRRLLAAGGHGGPPLIEACAPPSCGCDAAHDDGGSGAPHGLRQGAQHRVRRSHLK